LVIIVRKYLHFAVRIHALNRHVIHSPIDSW